MIISFFITKPSFICRKSKLRKKATTAESAIEENIPNAPKNTRKNGNINLRRLKILFLTKTNLAFLEAINTASINVKKTYRTAKTIKNTAYNLTSFRNINFGLKRFKPKTKMEEINNASIPDNKKQELTILPFSSDFGKYLINAILKPAKDNIDISSNEEINVVANPTSLTGYNLTTIVQNKKPKPDKTTEFIINQRAFLYRE